MRELSVTICLVVLLVSNVARVSAVDVLMTYQGKPIIPPGSYSPPFELSAGDTHTFYFDASVVEDEEFDFDLILEVLSGDADLLVEGPVTDPTGTVAKVPTVRHVSLHHTGEEYIFLSRDEIKKAEMGLYSAQVHGYGAENSYRLTIEKAYRSREPSEEEQAALDDIFQTCCWGSSCSDLRPLVRVQGNPATENFCHATGQACDQDGHITALRLPNNNMDCELPESISKLSFLKRLDLEDNYLFGEVSKLLTMLQDSPLQSIHLQKNDFTGPLACFPTTGNITEMEFFDASYNRIRGTIPGCFFGSNLKILTLEGNYLEGEFPELPASGNMKHVDLSWQEESDGKRFTGKLPDFRVWSNLTYLNVARNDFSGGFPLFPAGIEAIHVEYNNLEGALPAELADMPLKVLHIHGNGFTGSLPTDLPETLESLQMGKNAFTGSIPAAEWVSAGLQDLEEVRLEGNQLTGGIPSVFASMSKLWALNLTSNGLTGSLDNFAAALTALNKISQFDVAHNSLTGRLPEGLSQLYMLQGDYDAPPRRDSFQRASFDVSHNMFTGGIPLVLLEDAADQQRMLRFDVGGNQLTCPDTYLDLPLRPLPWAPKPLGDMTCLDEDGDEISLRESQNALRAEEQTSSPFPSATPSTYEPTENPTLDPTPEATGGDITGPGGDGLDDKDSLGEKEEKNPFLPTDPGTDGKRGEVDGLDGQPTDRGTESQSAGMDINTILIIVGVVVGALLVTTLAVVLGVWLYKKRTGKGYRSYDNDGSPTKADPTTFSQATVDIEQQEVAMAEMPTSTTPDS